MAEGGKSDRYTESFQGLRCVERNDRQRYEARHLMDGLHITPPQLRGELSSKSCSATNYNIVGHKVREQA